MRSQGDTSEPRAVLDALLKDEPMEAFPAGDVARAKELVRSVRTASAADLAHLPEPLVAAVLEATIQIRDTRLARELANGTAKPLAKAAKRTLYRFRSLGIEVPEEPIEAPSPLASQPTEELPCLLSPITGWGEQAVVVTRPLPGGGLELSQVLLSDERGLIGLGQRQVSRGEYRRQLKEIRSREGPPVMEIGREEALSLLSSAAALNLSSRTPYPSGSEELLRHFGVTPREEPLSLPPPQKEDQRLLADSRKLLDEPEMQAWLPPESEVRAFVAKMDEVLHSPLQLTEAQRSERLLHQAHSAASAFFTQKQRKQYAGRLWQMARLFENTHRDAAAKVARAQARQLFHSEVDAPVRFGELLFERVLSLMQQARPSAQPPQEEHRSPGGLILP